ncbi:Chitinase [Pannonibacter phragmitetus]|uniref:chitinase n=1 Tax=Pannonibacter phragmitetus TaxID=121719 RepID=A0A378ZRR4_9HYPH|nr:glycoside hydrolase family 18 protein [Pannonibacter phragmitetus]SUA99946.1 Chitinase [Pannonibacter phragmitetus]
MSDTTPRNIIYALRQNTPITGIIGSDFTHVILCFLLPQTNGTVAPSWELQQFLAKPNLVSQLQEGGKRKVMVSIGGENVPAGGWQAMAANLPAAAASIVSFLNTYGLDGIDIDYEDTGAISNPSGSGYDPVAFLAGLSTQVKAAPGTRLISHAPQPPYLYPGAYSSYPEGPYQRVMTTAQGAIDWLNIQYYNNPWYVGASAADQQQKVAGLSGGGFPSSIADLSVSIPPEKLVLGRVTSTDNGGSGYLDAATTAASLVQPLTQRFGSRFGGVMGWEFSLDTSSSANANAWGSAMAAAMKS